MAGPLTQSRPALLQVSHHTRRVRRFAFFAVAFGAFVVVVAVSLAVGAGGVPLNHVWLTLVDPAFATPDAVVVRELRVPRTIFGVLAGAALGVAGAVMQGLTRNPLADPGILGVNAGASLFVVLGISLLGVTSPAGFVWFALLGAACAAAVVYGVGALQRGGGGPVGLVLAGMAVTAGLTSITTLVLLTDSQTLASYRLWSVGSLAGRGVDAALPLIPFLAVGVVLAFAAARMLNVLALGEGMARGLGQNLVIARAVCGLAIVLLCGAATSLAGPIVFVGLVVPHVARRFAGTDYRSIVAWSLVLGPIMLLAADIVGRVIVPPGELEAGIVVALIGAPVLITLARHARAGALS